MRPTIKDIAQKTGLGLATISKYLNGGNVRDYNKAAIENAINELDYTVNELARGLKKNKSYTVGVIIPELNNTFITSIISEVENLLRNEGYGVIVCGCRTNEEYEAEAVKFLLGKKVDGIINMPVTKNGTHLKLALEHKIPIVLIDRMIPDLNDKVSAVLGNDLDASYNATQKLIDAGHRKIGILLGEEGIYTTNQRLKGYSDALKNNAIEIDTNFIKFSDYTVQGGYQGIKKMLNEKDLTGIFVTNYEMTLGAMIAINELKISIPDKISFIGFDNLELSEIIRPKLTIVDQPIEEIAKEVSRLFLKLEKENEANEIMFIDLKLQEGDSVSKLNN